MKSKKKKIVIITSSGVVIILLILWFTGLIGLWTNGISHIAYNSKRFTDSKGYILSGEYSISIDLSDLQSNVGKELYKDDKYSIYVSWIDNTGSWDSGGYRIGFRSSGQYSLTSASLISGIHHVTIGNSYSNSMSAKMKAEYNGRTYNSTEFGISALNYKDGDDFAFYIFPTESNQNKDISLNEKGIMLLTVSNLYKNIWSRK